MPQRKYGTFTGGIDLPDEKRSTLDKRTHSMPAPERLRVPLDPCGRKTAEPIVAAGDNVLAGQKIAKSTGKGSVDIFAPLNGRVSGVVKTHIAIGDRFVEIDAMEIVEISSQTVFRPLSQNYEWRSASPEAILRRMGEGGLTTLGNRPEPLGEWIDRAGRCKPKMLAANVMEGQPYVTASHRLLVDRGRQVARGLDMLAKVLKIPQVAIVADGRRTDKYKRFAATAKEHKIDLVALPHKYPIGENHILARVLTDREVPLGSDPLNVGLAIVDAATCFAIYNWVACGEPPLGRVVTVSGEHAHKPGNYWTPFGADCIDATGVADSDMPVIHGGPMIGVRCRANAVVGPQTDALLAIDIRPPKTPTPCIRCGWCTDHCPARLNVALLNDYFELADSMTAARAGAVACVDCGICSYVCPARLPLSQRVKQLKRSIGKTT